MSSPLLIRDVMRIGVPTCKLEDSIAHVAALMIDGGHTAVVVLDEEADTRGWVNEHILASAYARVRGCRSGCIFDRGPRRDG